MLKLTLGRNAACLIIGKNFEKSYSVQAHTQKQFPMLYALAIAAQIAFARRYVRMAFEKIPELLNSAAKGGFKGGKYPPLRNC